jgi:hypothetical protein
MGVNIGGIAPAPAAVAYGYAGALVTSKVFNISGFAASDLIAVTVCIQTSGLGAFDCVVTLNDGAAKTATIAGTSSAGASFKFYFVINSAAQIAGYSSVTVTGFVLGLVGATAITMENITSITVSTAAPAGIYSIEIEKMKAAP